MIKTSLVGLLGVASGVVYEHYRRRDPKDGHKWFMQTPPAATVYAAKPIDPKASSSDVKTTTIVDNKSSGLIGGDQWPAIGGGGGGGRVEEIARHGFPSLDNIRSFDNFILSYDRRNRTANWVLEHMSRHHLADDSGEKTHTNRTGIDFFEDQSVHEYWRSTNQDYRRSGYDRGHLAAAGNHRRDQKLVSQTFILSNIAPQVGKGFNRDAWNRLEKYCRWRARRSDNLWVCTGPLYLPARDPTTGKMYVKYEVIGTNHVAVPTHFFKVLVSEWSGKWDLEAFVMPNAVIDDRTRLDSFRVPIDTVERAAGLLFFQRIPRHQFRTINAKIDGFVD